MEEKFVFKSITIPVSHFKKEGVICPFCNSLQKRYISHIRKEHKGANSDIAKSEDFASFEEKLRNFMQKLKQREYREDQKVKDPQVFKVKQQEYREDQKVKDPQVFKVKQQKYRENQKKDDPDFFSEKQRKYIKAKRQMEPEKLKSDQKKWDAKRAEKNKGMEAGVKKFEEEMKYGAIFPCVCCHKLYNRNQVIEFDPDKIEKKAREAHKKKQNEKRMEELEDIFERLNVSKEEKSNKSVHVETECGLPLPYVGEYIDEAIKMIQNKINDWQCDKDKAGDHKNKFYTWLVGWFARYKKLEKEVSNKIIQCSLDEEDENYDEEEWEMLLYLENWLETAVDNTKNMVKSEADMIVDPMLLSSQNAMLDLVAFQLKVHWVKMVRRY
jgi:hypothetical protein